MLLCGFIFCDIFMAEGTCWLDDQANFTGNTWMREAKGKLKAKGR